MILSRKLGEKILIGEEIVLTVVDIDRGKIRLGVECPKEIPVDRMEVHERKQAERAAQPAA